MTGGPQAYVGALDRNLSPDEEEELARAMAHAMADVRQPPGAEHVAV